jgi:hypothetical protein
MRFQKHTTIVMRLQTLFQSVRPSTHPSISQSISPKSFKNYMNKRIEWPANSSLNVASSALLYPEVIWARLSNEISVRATVALIVRSLTVVYSVSHSCGLAMEIDVTSAHYILCFPFEILLLTLPAEAMLAIVVRLAILVIVIAPPNSLMQMPQRKDGYLFLESTMSAAMVAADPKEQNHQVALIWQNSPKTLLMLCMLLRPLQTEVSIRNIFVVQSLAKGFRASLPMLKLVFFCTLAVDSRGICHQI